MLFYCHAKPLKVHFLVFFVLFLFCFADWFKTKLTKKLPTSVNKDHSSWRENWSADKQRLNAMLSCKKSSDFMKKNLN